MRGITKKINKASQYVNEKIGSAKGTELEMSFVTMEKECQSLGQMIADLGEKMPKYLQMHESGGMSLLKSNKIPNERLLADHFAKFSTELTYSQSYAASLEGFAEAMKLQGFYKEQQDELVTKCLLEPMAQISAKELKEISYHSKKMVGRRLDYDCIKRKHAKNPVYTEELERTQGRFESSLGKCASAMKGLLNNDVERIQELLECAKAISSFHESSLENFSKLVGLLEEMSEKASQEVKDYNVDSVVSYSVQPLTKSDESVQKPWARALFNFVAENDDELSFPEGSCIELVSKVDDNWFFGAYEGAEGYFPVNYVDVVVPID